MKGRRVSVTIVLLIVIKAIAIKLLKTTSCAVKKDTKEIVFHKKKQELGFILILWGVGFVWGIFSRNIYKISGELQTKMLLSTSCMILH